MALVRRRQQVDILSGVLLLKPRQLALAWLQSAHLVVLGNQPGELLAGVAAVIHHVADHHHSFFTDAAASDARIYPAPQESSGSRRPFHL